MHKKQKAMFALAMYGCRGFAPAPIIDIDCLRKYKSSYHIPKWDINYIPKWYNKLVRLFLRVYFFGIGYEIKRIKKEPRYYAAKACY